MRIKFLYQEFPDTGLRRRIANAGYPDLSIGNFLISAARGPGYNVYIALLHPASVELFSAEYSARQTF